MMMMKIFPNKTFALTHDTLAHTQKATVLVRCCWCLLLMKIQIQFQFPNSGKCRSSSDLEAKRKREARRRMGKREHAITFTNHQFPVISIPPISLSLSQMNRVFTFKHEYGWVGWMLAVNRRVESEILGRLLLFCCCV
jgi:hypothetical protein